MFTELTLLGQSSGDRPAVDDGLPNAGSLTVTAATNAFLQTLAVRSPRTIATYRTGLRRWAEFLRRELGGTDEIYVNQLPETILEQFYVWLVRHHSRDRRATVLTYLAGARAFIRFLDRRRLLAPAVSYEQMRQQLASVS